MINSVTNQLKISEDAFVTDPIAYCREAYFGSPEWIPSEMISGNTGIYTDVYCFGMTLLEMITVRKPYSDCLNPAHIYSLTQNKMMPSELEAICDSELKQIIQSCLGEAKSRPTIQELLSMKFWGSRNQIDNHCVELH